MRQLGVTEPLQYLLRHHGEDGRGTLRHDRRIREYEVDDRQGRQDGDQQRDGRPWPQPARVPDVGHELGRRRLSRRQRGRQRIAAGQRREHRVDRRRAIRRIQLEAAQDDALDRRVHRFVVGLHRRNRSRTARAAQLFHRRARMSALPGEQLVEHQPQRVDVRAHGDLARLQLLRRHVGRRAGALRARLQLVREPGESEVGDAHAPSPVDHHVGRFEVAVQDVVLVGRGQTETELPGDLDRLALGRRAQPPQHVGQVLAVDVLHRQEDVPVDLADVVDAADVGMRDLARGAHLATDPLQCGRLGRQRFG